MKGFKKMVLILLALEGSLIISVVVFRAIVFLGFRASLANSFGNNILYAALSLGVLTYLALLTAAVVKKARNPTKPESIGLFVRKAIKFLFKLPFIYIEVLLDDTSPRAK